MDKTKFIDNFISIFEVNGLSEFAQPDIAEQFFNLTVIMLEVNSHMNLTSITDEKDIILKHYVDSLKVEPYIPQNAVIIDVGCGAGFPSLPLAIARKDIKITCIDSTAKKINYISDTADKLGLFNIFPKTLRAEDAAKDTDFRENFDVSVGRAVARLNILSELCIPFVKIGGKFIAMKASKSEEELNESISAFQYLGATLEKIEGFSLMRQSVGTENTENDERNLIILDKIKKTPNNFPRNYSQIKKKPL